MAKATAKQLACADTILFGRVTYMAMARYWQAKYIDPYAPREDIDYGEMMNSYKKVVFSKTLSRVDDWYNTRLAKQNLKKEIEALKQLPGKDMIIYGSGKLAAALIRKNLIDEYCIWLHPVIIDKGQPLFKNIRDKLNLKPFITKAFSNGVVLMRYEAFGYVNT